MTLPMQGPDARYRVTAYSILNFAGQAQHAKGQFKKYLNGQINVSSISSVKFHGKFALKLKMREFYEPLHSYGANSQAST